MQTARITALCCAALMVAACAPARAPGPVDERDREPRSARCLRIDQVDNWRVIDSRQLIVYGPRRDEPWHVRLITSCVQLRSSEVVGFRARGTNLLCGDPGDELLVRGERCAIRSMTRVSPLEAAALLDPEVHHDIGKLPPATPKE